MAENHNHNDHKGHSHTAGVTNERKRAIAIGNIAVILAAGGVFASATAWPDIIVAAILGYLALSGAWQILRVARKDLHKAATNA